MYACPRSCQMMSNLGIVGTVGEVVNLLLFTISESPYCRGFRLHEDRYLIVLVNTSFA